MNAKIVPIARHTACMRGRVAADAKFVETPLPLTENTHSSQGRQLHRSMEL
jgi:hypothetical protein